MLVVLAPHLDDEVIGCYSVLQEVDAVVYFTRDYREDAVGDSLLYHHADAFNLSELTPKDRVLIPSRWDYHPKHREVRKIGLGLCAEPLFYSVEMNVPWLEEEEDPEGKRKAFDELYPQEEMPNPKYWLFRSIKPYDEVIWASVRFAIERYHRWPDAPEEVAFLRSLHRHIFCVEVDVQQFGDDRDLEYFLLQRRCLALVESYTWRERTSCEMLAIWLKRKLEAELSGVRLVRVTVREDAENGAIVE
jgi:hypothetical protein